MFLNSLCSAWFNAMNFTNLISFQLENGSDLRQEDNEGCGPLHHAAREGHVDVAAKLLELGAQVKPESLKLTRGQTRRAWATFE